MKIKDIIVESSNMASAEQIWDYVGGIHPKDQQGGGFLKRLIMRNPQYELKRVPLSSLHVPNDEDDGNDPYGRAMFVDVDHAREYSQHHVDKKPVVADAEGHILDGAHRAWAAAELLNRTDIMAWVPAEKLTESQSVKQEIKDFIDSLTPADVGVEEFPGYRVHFEGFTDDCKSSSDYQRNPNKVYQQVYQDFVQREGGQKPAKSGMTGDEEYPILYSVFRVPQSKTVDTAERAYSIAYRKKQPWPRGSREEQLIRSDWQLSGLYDQYVLKQGVAEEQLDELFQPGKQNWTWKIKADNEAIAKFTVGDRDYVWQAFSHFRDDKPHKWEIQFRVVKQSTDPEKLQVYGTTGTGNSAEVMSNAVDIMREFLQYYGDGVQQIAFDAKENSRIALYRKMVQRLLPNWNADEDYSSEYGLRFTLTRPKSVAEGKDFDRCFDQACKLYDRAVNKNLKPKLVQVADFQGDGNGADPRWMKLPQHIWQHYVVIVGDQVLDPTAKQFGDSMPTQYKVSDLDRLWGKQYQIRPRQGVADDEELPEGLLGNMLPWPEVVNKINSAMKAMGWKGQRKDDGSFIFTTRGTVTDEYYIVIIDNRGDSMFTYALGTVEEGDPHIGEQDTLPTTEASVSELMNAIRDGFGLNENFADGRNPGRKGLAKRSGVNTKASVSSLRKTAKNSSGEKQRMAHWLANMKAGRAKARKK